MDPLRGQVGAAEIGFPAKRSASRLLLGRALAIMDHLHQKSRSVRRNTFPALYITGYRKAPIQAYIFD
ncbi:hypothetical protein D3C78_1636290 [compost metagenome]